MKKLIFAILVVAGLGMISCSQKSQKEQIEEEEIGCLCCPVEEAPEDTLDIIAP